MVNGTAADSIVRRFLLSNPLLVHVTPSNAPLTLRGRPLVFVHIPRSGGTTLDRIVVAISLKLGLGRFRAPGTVYGQFLGNGKPEASEVLRRTDAREFSGATLFSGHVPAFHWDAKIGAQRPAYVTILRDPVERMISQYRFGLARGGWDEGTSMERLVRSGQLLDNLQTRMLADCADGRQPCDEALLEKAFANLQHRFSLVGLSGHFDRFLATLLGLLAWPDIVYANYNVTTNRPPLARSETLHREAVAFSAFDAKLIERVRRQGAVWANLVDAGAPPARDPEVLMPLVKEGEFLQFSRQQIPELERLALQTNCRLIHAPHGDPA